MPIVLIWFLILHFYTFIVFVIYLSFHLFTVMQRDDGRRVVQPRRQLEERLDDRVKAIHAIHRTALKRKYEDAGSYGVSRVSKDRSRVLGFKRRLLSYQRQAQIYVPEISPNSRRCDLWNERQDVGFLVKCRVSQGEQACFNCIESRRFVRHCVHLPRPIRLALNRGADSSSIEDDGYLDVPANESTDEGYCLSSVFANTIQQENGQGYRPADKSRNCNPNTGEWLLARLSVLGDSSYNWLCRCRYPNLVTNQTTLFSDCTRPVGCKPHGQLDPDSQKGLVNPYTEGRCVCEAGYRADRDSTVGPVCVSKPVLSSEDLLQDVYARYRINLTSSLSWPRDQEYLDQRIATYLGNSERELQLPNPCSYDAATGNLLDPSAACWLVRERLQDDYVAYCVTNSFDSIPVRSDRDYLRGNNGRYSNACLLVHHTSDTTNTRNAILSYQTSLDVPNPRPDFGLLFERSPQLEGIVRLVRDTDEWKGFVANIEMPQDIDQPFNDKDIRLCSGSMRGWLCAYQQSPIQARVIEGLLARLLGIWLDREKAGGAVYNLRNRQYYWFKVRNPFGNVHWNNGLREELANNVGYASVLIQGSEFIYDQVTIDPAGFAYTKGTARPRDYKITGNSASRTCNLVNPTVYPCREFVFPFASGSDIDDEIFGRDYYPTLHPLYSVKRSPPPKQPVADMPFVYNTIFDRADSTLMLHLKDDELQRLYISAEQLCGNYKNHRALMRGRLQSDYV